MNGNENQDTLAVALNKQRIIAEYHRKFKTNAEVLSDSSIGKTHPLTPSRTKQDGYSYLPMIVLSLAHEYLLNPASMTVISEQKKRCKTRNIKQTRCAF